MIVYSAAKCSNAQKVGLNTLKKTPSFVQQDLCKQLLVQLVYAVAVVYYLETTHHVAGDACALFVADALADRIVFALGVSELVVVVALGFEPPLDGLYIVLALCV